MSERDRDSTSESGGGHHNIVLAPEERKLFGQLFQAADCEGIGVVTGELAVKFFEKSGLSPRILGEIWGIADTENRGLLTKVGFSVALRLIGQAQNGQHPRPELAQQPGPLPRFEGVNMYPPPPTTSSPTLPPIQQQTSGPAGVVRVPPLMPQDVEKFTVLFEKSGAVDGILQGQQAREIFQRSKLPTPTLIQIWQLADRQHRGALGVAEFVVAMHLITCSKNGSLPVLPQILPPGLYEAAAGRPPGRNGQDRRGGPGRPPVSQIPRQFSGSNAQRAQSPLSRQYTPPAQQQGPPIQQQNLTGGWAISPQEKQRFDAVFVTVEKANPNVITGEEAVPFFSNSKLSEEVLAQIWDLADVNKAGILTRDEFAIAMYLIVQQHANPGRPLPDVLPANLIPPSMRQQRPVTAAVQPPPSPFDAAPQQPPVPPKSAADDLFGLDAFTSSVPQQAPGPSPFDNNNDAFGSSKDGSPAMSPTTTHAGPSSQAPAFLSRPTPSFVPQSSFGQSILPASTGGSIGSASPYAQQQQNKPEMDDLLGDADPEVSKKLTNETTELANLSNQIGTLTKRTQELKQKRASTEMDLSTLTTQKQNIEAQLNQLRSAYEKEAAQVRRAEDQLAASRTETTRATQEYQRIEAEYNQLQYKRQEISSQLEADRRENENLKERMSVINAENRQLREEVERLTSQARREKGLVSINKKQVGQSEQEREKLRGNIEESRSSVTSPVPASPTLSQVSNSTNPFHRKSPPAVENAFASSPFAPAKHGAMDDVFGPAFGASAPPSAFSHKSELTGPSEGGHGEHSTPPTSPPASTYQDSPHQSEAPPVTAQNQMSSAFLPISVTRTESATSSVQVNPSASVRGESEFSRPETPTNWMGSAAGDSNAARTDDRRGSFSVKSDAGTEASGRAFSSIDNRRAEESKSPFAVIERNTTGTTSGGDENKPRLEKSDSFSTYVHVPGAFPGTDGSAPIKPTATGDSHMSNRSRTSNASKSAFSNDPFSLGKDETRSNASKHDLDDAFGKLGRLNENHTGGSASVGGSKFDSEFPPIQEFHQDSDSDSDAGGFDDNFTSPAQKAATSGPAEPTPNTESAGTPVAPPAANAQSSPPPYGQATANQEKSGFPAEFSSLLPSRSDAMRHDAPTPGGGTNTVTFPAPPNAKQTAAPVKDEFDDEFADLSDAKEADDKSAQDDFNTPSAFDDFNVAFEGSTPKNSGLPSSAVGDADDFAKFSFNIDESGQSTQPQTESPVLQTAKPATAQDWDAIFADFGNQPASGTAEPPRPPKDDAFEANGNQSGEQAIATSSRQSGTDPGEGGGVSLSSSSDLPPPATSAAPPSVGTATTTAAPEGGATVASNDEKVSKLTALGFDRESSLKALDKNDWDIDRAANSLLAGP